MSHPRKRRLLAALTAGLALILGQVTVDATPALAADSGNPGRRFGRRLYQFLYVDSSPLRGTSPYRPAVDGPLR